MEIFLNRFYDSHSQILHLLYYFIDLITGVQISDVIHLLSHFPKVWLLVMLVFLVNKNIVCKIYFLLPPASKTRYLFPGENTSILEDPSSNFSTGNSLQNIDAASGSNAITRQFLSIPACT